MAQAERNRQPKKMSGTISLQENSGESTKESSLRTRNQDLSTRGEKILMKGERMPEDWPVFGATGYAFLNSLNGIFVDGASAKAFDEI